MEATLTENSNDPGDAPEFDASLREPSARVRELKDDLFDASYSICLMRPLLLKAFRRTAKGRRAKKEHPLVRRAMAVAYVCSHRKPIIYNGEVIVGNMTSKRTAANYYPEGGSLNILEDVFRLEKRHVPLQLSFREKVQLIRIGLTEMWTSIAGRTLLRPGRMSHFLDFFFAKRYFVTEEAGIAHQVGGYWNIVHFGLKRADEMAARCLEKKQSRDGKLLSEDQLAFYQSVRIAIEGIREMASNLADEAETQSEHSATNVERRTELLRIAEICRHVPFEPARTFQEGLQACWLVHLAMNMEDYEQGMSFGRLDRILFPLYRRGIEKGNLTSEQAAELMACFGLKTCETLPIYSQRIDQFFSGNGVAQGITVGGTDEEGRDSTNELSGVILDGYAQIRTREPALHVRVHSQTPQWFLKQAADIVRLGCGKPSFFGDEAIITALEKAGMTKAHARDYAIIGCVEMASQGRTYNSSDAALFNLPLCLELALNEGHRFKGSGFFGKRFGAASKPLKKMASFDDVVSAFRSQVEDAVAEMVKVITWLEAEYRIWRPTAINSIVTEGCLENGCDVTWGGALYDLTSIQAAGLADVGDSLFAIKKLVFDEQRLSLARLVQILKSNFRGEEKLQHELAERFPKYGNGINEVDRITQLAADVFADTLGLHRNSRGGQYVAGVYSMTCHIGFGRITGALPNGRPAGNRLSNGLSPSDGADRCGPTAFLQSASSLDSSNWANCCALNMKFDPNLVKGEVGLDAMTSLIRTYFDQGGMQVQINVLDAEMLREAQRDPSAHPGLVVRVAGYCAYFNDLQPAVQDEIIARTVHSI